MTLPRHAPVALTSIRSVSRGDGTDVHFHDEHQILYASRGLLSVTTDKGVWLTPGARAVWIPAGTPHQHNAFGALTIHTVGLPDVPNPAGVNSTSVVTINRLARDIIMELSEVSNPGDAAAQRLRWVLLDQLTRSVEFPLRVRRPHDPRLILISEAIEQDPQGVSSLDDAARLISVSSRTMSRLCQADLGMTFPQWRTQLRLHRALELLADGWSVTDVAVHCGWSTASSFIDVFRRTLGYTPGRRTTAA